MASHFRTGDRVVAVYHEMNGVRGDPSVSEGAGWGAKTDRPRVLDEELRWFWHGEYQGLKSGVELHVNQEMKQELVANPSTVWGKSKTEY